MRYAIFIIYAVIFLLSADLVHSDTKGWRIQEITNRNNRYGVLTKLKDEDNELFLRSYFVRWKDTIETSRGDFDIVDSQFAMGIQVCDTNAFSYVITDSLHTYLVASILSPSLKIDTLIKLERKVSNERGWFYQYSDVLFSLRDSLIIGPSDIFQNDSNINISNRRQIWNLDQSGVTTAMKKQLDIKYSTGFSFDFSQALFVKDPLNSPSYFTGPPYSSIVIYDIKADSLIEFSDSVANLSKPGRRSKMESLFYLRAFEGTINLWKALPDGTRKQLTYLTAPNHVEWYYLRTDAIEYVVRDNFAGKGAGLVYFIKE